MTTPKDSQDLNTSVPQDKGIESDAAGRARSSDPNTSVPQDEVPNTSVPQDDK
jgi:hypothetical protein